MPRRLERPPKKEKPAWQARASEQAGEKKTPQQEAQQVAKHRTSRFFASYQVDANLTVICFAMAERLAP